jgi:lactate dehydrogenase-like 2-hydroxyacid dehydrogenase
MKAVAYSIQPYEKEFLAIANHKKHDITLISNPLNFDTVTYAAGKNSVIVSTTDLVSADIIKILAGLHIKYIISRSADIANIDKEAAARCGITLANAELPAIDAAYLTTKVLQETADQMIRELDLFQLTEASLMVPKKIKFH